ncbi:MAG: DUF1186 domain-containing protein [Lewinellaceae bacterium]|nr:DUF1186 domain-containing protein [Lewinellaceae bacterium]
MKPSLDDLGVAINYDILDHGYTPEQDQLVDELYAAATKGKRQYLPKIKQAIRRFPHLPVFKNFLYVLYGKLGMKAEARRVLETIRELHPQYVTGKITRAMSALDDNKMEEAAEILCHFDLKELARACGRQELHYSEVLKTWFTAARYHLQLDDPDRAEHYWELMEELEPDSNEGELIAQALVIKRMQKGMERMKKEREAEQWVESYPTYIVEQSEEAPELPHPELEALYEYSEEDLPEDVIREILELPRDSLRAGLRMILEDCCRRFDYFTEKYEDGWDPDEQNFHIHALYFLRQVGEPEDLDALLNLYRQGKEVLHYWFGDYFSELNWYTLYELGQGQLDKLKAFVLEPNLYYEPRLEVARALAQLAMHRPERRTEVLDWFRDVFQYHLDHPRDKTRVDTAFLGWSAAEVLDLRARELWPLIEQMYEQGFIPPHYMGNLEDLKNEMERPFAEFDKKPLPADIFEHYEGGHHKRRAKAAPVPEIEAMLKDEKHGKLLSAMASLMNKAAGNPDPEEEEEEPEYWEPTQPIRSTKVGRNDPCPCGSGKKYKKCCGKK